MFKEEMKMKSFSYTVKDEMGIHARPAGMLVKEVKNFQSKVILEKDGKSVGDDEGAACDAIKAFFETNL